MEIKHTLYKLLYRKQDLFELPNVTESDLNETIAYLKDNGYWGIKHYKQTQYLDACNNIIFENDVAILKTGGSIGSIEACALVVFLKDNYVYKYSKGWGNKGVKMSLNHNNLNFKDMIVIGNVELLKNDLADISD